MSGSGDETKNEDGNGNNSQLQTPKQTPEKTKDALNTREKVVSVLNKSSISSAKKQRSLTNIFERPGASMFDDTKQEESDIRRGTSAVSSSSHRSVRNSTTAAQELLNILKSSDETDDQSIKKDVRKMLERGKTNESQMISVWGNNIVNWAKCSRDNVNCPCCFLCGLPINKNDSQCAMEHKIPSVPAYLNAPHFDRIGQYFFKTWQTYIKLQKNVRQLTELYKLINCVPLDYNQTSVNNKFNEIFNAANLPAEPPNYNYWREILKFWMMEFAYAHKQCNSAKSATFICGDLTSDGCVLDNIENPRTYEAFANKVKNPYKKNIISRRVRTTNMFRHLNGVLNEVQRLSCERSGCESNETARSTIHILNLRYAQVRPEYERIQQQIKENNDWIKQANARITENNSTTNMRPRYREEAQKETIRLTDGIMLCKNNIAILTQQLRELWTTETDIADELDNDAATQPDVVSSAAGGEEKEKAVSVYTGKSAGGEEKFKTSGNITPPPRESVEINTSLSSANTSQSSSGYSADTASSRAKKRTKYNPTIGGTLKNKRRTQKRIASRRRKRNKRSTTRRKRYTRKQKK